MSREHLLPTQDKASEKRKEHLRAIGEMLTAARNTAVKHIVNEILKVEEPQELAFKLRASTPKASNTGPLNSVLIPSQDESGWTRVYKAADVEEEILK